MGGVGGVGRREVDLGKWGQRGTLIAPTTTRLYSFYQCDLSVLKSTSVGNLPVLKNPSEILLPLHLLTWEFLKYDNRR